MYFCFRRLNVNDRLRQRRNGIRQYFGQQLNYAKTIVWLKNVLRVIGAQGTEAI